MTEMKAQLLTELPYHRVSYFKLSSKVWRFKINYIFLFLIKIEQPRKPNKYLEFFGSYIALPLMTIVLVLSLLILFLLVKTYFSNSYMYAIQDNLDNKNELNIGAIIDTRYDQFNNRPKTHLTLNLPKNTKQSSLLERVLSQQQQQVQIQSQK